MDFSTMVLTMYLASDEGLEEDERVLDIAVEQSLAAAELGYNPWFTEHHFRGPWHSQPMQFAAYVAALMPKDRYLGFGVLSTPYYHPVRLVESMNLLDQLTKGHTLFGLGSGFPGLEPLGLGVEAEYHGSGRAAADTLEVMNRLWDYRLGDPEYTFELPTNRGTIKRRVVPGAYRKRHPIIIRTARRDDAVITAAKNGWPAFLGTFGSPLDSQMALYRETLAAANHPPEVVAECMRWCTTDWLAVVVADTDEEARANAVEAKTESLAIRQTYISRAGSLDGPTVKRDAGQTSAAAFAAGGDMTHTIAGSPETVAARVQELVEVGLNHLLVRFLGEWTGTTRYISEKSMRLFANEVMPRFKDIAPLSNPATIAR
jgi:alkanesulfonate monooxygenase SsuD/methylene tetrahydromethanopterin reductase-like flavin-dependent oxidoreductase (luciferase family)